MLPSPTLIRLIWISPLSETLIRILMLSHVGLIEPGLFEAGTPMQNCVPRPRSENSLLHALVSPTKAKKDSSAVGILLGMLLAGFVISGLFFWIPEAAIS